MPLPCNRSAQTATVDLVLGDSMLEAVRYGSASKDGSKNGSATAKNSSVYTQSLPLSPENVQSQQRYQFHVQQIRGTPLCQHV